MHTFRRAQREHSCVIDAVLGGERSSCPWRSWRSCSLAAVLIICAGGVKLVLLRTIVAKLPSLAVKSSRSPSAELSVNMSYPPSLHFQCLSSPWLCPFSWCCWAAGVRPYLSDLAVANRCRRMGIGTELVKACEKFCIGWGYDQMWVHHDPLEIVRDHRRSIRCDRRFFAKVRSVDNLALHVAPVKGETELPKAYLVPSNSLIAPPTVSRF